MGFAVVAATSSRQAFCKELSATYLDTGSKALGIAAVGNGKALFAGEVELRRFAKHNNRESAVAERAMLRRSRRSRKTRYRKPRFLNRPRVKCKVCGGNTPKSDRKMGGRARLCRPYYENVRSYVFARDRWTCLYCQGESGDRRLTTDHIVPRGRGGSDRPDNLATACYTCNEMKGNQTKGWFIPFEFLG